MSYLPFAIVAFFLNAVAVTVDKFLLTKSIPNPLLYIFYISLFSLVSLVLLPFTNTPALETFSLSSISTLFWTLAAYAMFRAIQIGQVSRVVPIIGVLMPLFLLTYSSYLGQINQTQIYAILLLILGLVVLTILDWRGDFSKRELALEILSAFLFALSYIVLKEAYSKESFLTVFTYSKIILIPLILVIFLVPKFKAIVLSSKGPKLNFFTKVGALFLLGQLTGASSQLLILFAISLATPTLVNSLQGVQYVFLFAFSLMLSRVYPNIFNEKLSSKVIFTKITGIILISIGLSLLAFY